MDTLKMGGSYLIGREMNEFKAKSVSGKKYSSKSLQNKITVINFWFEACSPCLAEVEALNDLFEKFSADKKFQFLSFTFDPKESVIKFTTRHNIKYPVIILSNEECSALNFRKGYPGTVITDLSGKIIYYKIGGSIDPEVARTLIEREMYPVIEKELVK